MVMRRSILTSFLLLIIFISGCVEQNGEITPEYNDEALKVQIELTDRVLPSQGVNMKVYLTNQVENEVKDVYFRVTDFYGLNLISQICPENNAIPQSECGFGISMCGCGSFNVQSLDEEEIEFRFKVPSQEEISRIGRELEPEFTLEYYYEGETTYFIPIIGPSEKSTSAKSELIQTKGPIHVDIDRGFTSSSNDWERQGSGFSIVVDVKDVVNPQNEDVIIETGNFNGELINLINSSDFGDCNFDVNTAGEFSPKDDITLPMEVPLICALVDTLGSSNAPWTYAQVRIEYNYVYESVETESITVETVID